MAEILINITDEEYEYFKRLKYYGYGTMFNGLVERITNGVVLPKGHGRIADVDKMLDEMRSTRTYDVLFALERVKPIIEADKAESEVLEDGKA